MMSMQVIGDVSPHFPQLAPDLATESPTPGCGFPVPSCP